MKKPFLMTAALAVVLAFAGGQLLKADTIVSLGNTTSGFTSGEQILPGNFTFGTGAPAPFNEEYGSNGASNDSFNKSWTFNYTPPSTITGATLTIGIYDSPWEGSASSTTPRNTDQVASFTLDGSADLTALLNAEINLVGTGINTYEIDTITIPSTDLALLASGSATFSLALQGPGNSLFGPKPSLAAGLEFSTLDLMTGSVKPPATTPEPASAILLISGLAAVGIILKRRALLGF